MPAFFLQKKLAFFGKNGTFTQSNSVKAVLEMLVTINENVIFINSGIRLSDSSKFTINLKNDDYVKICRHGGIVNYFDVVLFLLSILDSGQYHVNIIAGSGFFTIQFIFLFCKGLTRSPEIGNTSA